MWKSRAESTLVMTNCQTVSTEKSNFEVQRKKTSFFHLEQEELELDLERLVGIWVNQEKKGKAKRMGNKWREEKHRGRKKMKRPIYLEIRLWEGEWKRQVRGADWNQSA